MQYDVSPISLTNRKSSLESGFSLRCRTDKFNKHQLDSVKRVHAMENTAKKIKGVVTLENRTWNDEEYSRRARERREAVAETMPLTATVGISVHDGVVDIESRVGIKSSFNINSESKRTGKGFWCKVCEVEFLDSSSYLEHNNSRSHQGKLGKSMLVTESSLCEVKLKLALMKRKKQDISSQSDGKSSTDSTAKDAYEKRRQILKNEEREKKRRKKEMRGAKMINDGSRSACSTVTIVGGGKKLNCVQDESKIEVSKEELEKKQMAELMGFDAFK